MLKRVTEERWFSDSLIPLMIMAVDLTGRAPFPQREGPIWEAQLAALRSLVFPPQERNGPPARRRHRAGPRADASVLEDGADVVVSVNLMSAEALDRLAGRPGARGRAGRKRACSTRSSRRWT